MFWMGPMGRGGLLLLPGIAGLAVGALLLSGNSWLEDTPEAAAEKTIRAYVDGKPVRSYVVVEEITEQ